MKDYLVSLVNGSRNPEHGRNITREYLQARILGSLQRGGAMIALAFQGGTALRFLYSIPRFSEDLDFSLERPEAGYDFRVYLDGIEKEFHAEAYNVGIRFNDRKTVHSAFVRFYGLPYELGFSTQPGEALSIKIEVDTQPPAGAGITTTLIRRYETLQLQHHDRASLLAGKLHAILQRAYTKGRDVYDLIWYLSDPTWPSPNLELLNNALQQTGWKGQPVTRENWRGLLCAYLEEVDWRQVRRDIQPFLERAEEANLLTEENLRQVLACAANE